MAQKSITTITPTKLLTYTNSTYGIKIQFYVVLHNIKSLICRDTGFDYGAVIKEETEDEIMQKAGDHAIIEHNMKPEDMTLNYSGR